jgi:NAD(P)-dependent dehydrogenase (short-subunit alcohol dehydrogenase family)
MTMHSGEIFQTSGTATMSDPLFAVAGQVVLVSGGSRGIGRAIAQGFAERGAQVVISSRDAKNLAKAADELSAIAAAAAPTLRGCKAAGTDVATGTDVAAGNDVPAGTVKAIAADVAQSADIERLVDETLAAYGRIDTLINVAGVNRRKPALELTEDDYDFILDINLKGAFLLSRAVGRHMVARRGGNQINIASLNTDRPLKNVLPYAVSKAGIAHMTRALAVEWGPAGVRVNAVAPGFILTDLTRKLWSEPTMQAWGFANTPLQRLGQPEDMVGAALFLASAGSSFMTGQTVYVDGGFTAGWNWPIPQGGGQ